MKRIFALILIVVICLFFTSCESVLLSVDKLIRPPELSGTDKMLQEAFENSVSEYDSFVLKFPINGKFKSSYILYDIDNKGYDEAIILYSVPSLGSNVIVEVFKYNEDNWNSVSKIVIDGNRIDELDFADINGDGCNEFFISWSDSHYNKDYSDVNLRLNSSHSLKIYSYDGVEMKLVGEEVYSNLFIKDLNNDKSSDVVLFNNNISNIENTTSMRILSYNKDFTVKYDKTTVISDMLDIVNIVSDRTVNGRNSYSRIFVDGSVNESDVITEIIEIDEVNFNVTLPLYADNLKINPSTLRDSIALCMDIGEDGSIEIPSIDFLPFSEKITDGKSSPLTYAIWSEFKDNQIKVKYKTLIDMKVGYVAFIPEQYIGTIAVKYDENNLNYTFYSVDSYGNVKGALFSFRIFTLPQWEENSFNYEILNENDTYVYAFLIFKADNYDTYKKYITDYFFVFNIRK